jgi:hypothetical protein
LWIEAVRIGGTWEERVRTVVAAELAQKPWVTPQIFSGLLVDIGADVNEKALVSLFSSGAIPLSLFLQCIVVLGSSSLDRYIDFPDLVSAVRPTIDDDIAE